MEQQAQSNRCPYRAPAINGNPVDNCTRVLFVALISSSARWSPQFNKHLFVHIGQSNPSYSDAYLESVDVRQIYDKFPEKKGGLKDLFDKGPRNAFFLVKFWVKYTETFILVQFRSVQSL